MRCRNLLPFSLLVLAVSVLTAAVAAAQGGPGYRRVQPLSIQPSSTAPGLFDIFAPLDIHGSADRSPVDLSTVMELRVNGITRRSLSWVIQTDGPVTGDCALECGTGCGGLYVDGVFNTMTCHEDSEGDCQCGYWIAAPFAGEPLQTGDEIMVIIYPAPGAVPEGDTSDDQILLTFDGATPGWNRQVAALAVQPSATAGDSFFDITYVIDFHAQTQTFLDLSIETQLVVNGIPRGLPHTVDVHPAGPTGDCESSCGAGCGPLYVDGVINTMTCHEDGPGDCDCGYWFTSTFPGEPLQPGDEIMVILRPAPGAIPDEDESDDLLIRTFDGTRPGWDRSIRNLSVLDGAAGGDSFFDIWVEIDVHADGVDGHLDLSSELELLVNGSSRGVLGTWSLIPSGPPVGNCSTDCVSNCGGMYVDGVFNNQLCHRDAEDDCRCGYWFTATLPEEPLSPGDEIMVILRPAPGALPDPDGADDMALRTFDGNVSGWNRAITNVVLNDVGGGFFEVVVDGTVATDGQEDYRDLSFDLDLVLDGVAVATMSQDFQFLPDPPGPTKVDCQQDCSGGSCGTVKPDPSTWIAAQCLTWPGFAGCSCGSGWTVVFPLVPLPPAPDLKLVLRPAPGALPELPGFDEDDERRPDPPTAVEMPASLRTSLDQNRPNPFNPTTSIAFRTSKPGHVTLDIFDARGRHVRALVDDWRPAGAWSERWDGRTDAGVPAASGHYFYRLATEAEVMTRKMTLLK